ncbi:glycosyltransferase [Leucothrix sargassi]|nr:glycosyltransferase [Leucothrix sargassi]
MKKVLIIDTHPVQYRAPIYSELSKDLDLDIHVLYFNVASAKGYFDKEFNKEIKWNSPLLDGYKYSVCFPEHPKTTGGFFEFSKVNVSYEIKKHNPDLIIIHSLNYFLGLKFAIVAKLKKIPCWLRVESQDKAYRRSFVKGVVRKVLYRFMYNFFDGAFYFGKLNKEHLLQHGFKESQLIPTYFSTVNKCEVLSLEQKRASRDDFKNEYDVDSKAIVVGVFGKLIPKKDPETVFRACLEVARIIEKPVICLVVGSGELEAELKEKYQESTNVRFIFLGFVNQNEINKLYLSSDVVVLASRYQGEVWGLVCNEALQAGCALAMSDAVGASEEFKHLQRCGTFSVGDVKGLADLLLELTQFEHNFDWSSETMMQYSTEAAATNISNVAKQIESK